MASRRPILIISPRPLSAHVASETVGLPHDTPCWRVDTVADALTWLEWNRAVAIVDAAPQGTFDERSELRRAAEGAHVHALAAGLGLGATGRS